MPFGGIYSVIREFSSIERLIDSELGLRVKAAGYQYSEIVRTMMCNYSAPWEKHQGICPQQQISPQIIHLKIPCRTRQMDKTGKRTCP